MWKNKDYGVWNFISAMIGAYALIGVIVMIAICIIKLIGR